MISSFEQYALLAVIVLAVVFGLERFLNFINRIFPVSKDKQLLMIVATTRSIGKREVMKRAYAAYIQKKGPQEVSPEEAVLKAYTDYTSSGAEWEAPYWLKSFLQSELGEDVAIAKAIERTYKNPDK